jgi:HEAT repeat protein
MDGDGRPVDLGAPVRARALGALAKVGAPGVHEGLVRALSDSDEEVRIAAIRALRERGDNAAAAPLAEAVATWTDPELASSREQALKVLESIQDPDVPLRVAATLVSRTDDLDGGDEQVLRRLTGVTNGGDRAERTVSYLMSVLGDRSRAERAITMLVWLAPASLQPLLDALADVHKREQAIVALGYTHDRRAVEPLCKLMVGSPDPRLRRAAAWAAGEIRDPLAIESLLQAMSDSDFDVRAEAGAGLDRFGNGGMALALSTLLRPAIGPTGKDPRALKAAEPSAFDAKALAEGTVVHDLVRARAARAGERSERERTATQAGPESRPAQPVQPEPAEEPATETTATASRPRAGDARPAVSRESLASRDLDGLAEMYDIAADAWRAALRAGNAEKAEGWQAVATAVVDEALGREKAGRGFARAGGGRGRQLLHRRRNRLRAQLRRACAERG